MAKGSGLGKERHSTARGTAAVLLALFAGVSPFALLTPAAAQAQSETVEFNIPAQAVGSALVAYARQAGVQLVMTVEPSNSVRSNPVHGALPPDEALARLLQGTGYEGRFENGSLRLRHISADADAPQRRSATDELVQLAQADDTQGVVSDADARGARRARGVDLEEEEPIIVVGTNIRGVHPDSSPVEIYTAEDIARTGVVTTEQFVSKLPQNLGRNAPSGATPSGNAAANSIDLRGLGVGTTLVLLNGRRLALATNGQAADISSIPLSALERVEVLTDGASAIYGSDAIGGVVNFVLRDDLDGAETRVSYGGVTAGGAREGALGQSVGTNWGSGKLLASYNYYSASALETFERRFSTGAGPGTLTPHNERHSALLTTRQEVGQRLSLSADLVLSQRDVKSTRTSPTFFITTNNEAEESFVNLGLDYELTPRIDAALLLTYSQLDTDSVIHQRRLSNNARTRTRNDSNYAAFDATAKVSGELFVMAGGVARFSAGAGVLNEQFRTVTNGSAGRELGRATSYAFGEVFLPILSEGQDSWLGDRFEISLAARYTHLEDASTPSLDTDFGDHLSPKVGVLWAPSQEFRVRGTYGESFRAPSLLYVDPANAANSLTRPSAFGGSQVVLTVLGSGNPTLAPETLDTRTFGFDYEPSWATGLRVSATYFDIEYQDKIGVGDPSNGGATFANPGAFPELFLQSPPEALIADILANSRNFANTTGLSINFSDPAVAAAQLAALGNFSLFDNRTRNLASARLNGFDVSFEQQVGVGGGELTLGATATYIDSYTQRGTPNSIELSVVDQVLLPVDLRVRGIVSFERDRLDAALSVNYSDEYENRYAAGGPQQVDSWTTVDLNIAYMLTGRARLNLSGQNVFDEDPPFVAASAVNNAGVLTAVGYDPANANPLGRVVTLGFRWSW